MSRRVMFAPIRPKPTIPICMKFSPSGRTRAEWCEERSALAVTEHPWIRGNLSQRFLHRCRESFQPGRKIGPEMHPQRPSTAFCKHLEVSARLGGFHYTERVFLAGHRRGV